MKNRLIISLILLLSVVWPFSHLHGQPENLLRITALRISPSDDTATISWSTNLSTTGHFEFGLTNGFGNWLDDNLSGVYHETTLAGLLPKETYYFRLTARTLDGQEVKSDVYNFETLEEDDHKAPIVSDVHTSFITGNTATFVWETDEASDSCVYLGGSIDKLDTKRCHGTRLKIHDLTVTNLKRNTFYYYRISSKDRANNIQYSVNYNFITNFDDDRDIPELVIYEISPFNRRSGENTNEVVVAFNTNRPVEGSLRYGEKPNSYNQRVYLPAPRQTYTEVVLSDLKENQTYYYRLELKDVLNKRLNTPEFSFKTLPSTVLTTLPTQEPFNFSDPRQDFDHDGLTNSQEQEYGTDPLKTDTDGDGYIDGVEVFHGYNPKGPGRLGTVVAEKVAATSGFAYGQERLKSLTTERNLALDLKQKLEQYFKTAIPKSNQHWFTLVNAYIYGGYPIEAIAKAIEYGGKTVHPTIPWSSWKNSADYQNYINK